MSAKILKSCFFFQTGAAIAAGATCGVHALSCMRLMMCASLGGCGFTWVHSGVFDVHSRYTLDCHQGQSAHSVDWGM